MSRPADEAGEEAVGEVAAAAANALPASDFTTAERVDRMVAPVITGDEEFYRALFSGASTSFDDLRARAEKGEPLEPFTLSNVDVTIRIDNQYELVSTELSKNVVGVVEGTDPRLKDTYVFYGAHLDHEGYRFAPRVAAHSQARTPI